MIAHCKAKSSRIWYVSDSKVPCEKSLLLSSWKRRRVRRLWLNRVKPLKSPQSPVVQTLDSAIQRISIGETNCTIHRIEIYPVHSAIQPWTTEAWTSQSSFIKRKYPFIDKLMVMTDPIVPHGRLLGLGSKLYDSNMQRMLNKDLTQFKQSLTWVPQNGASKRKALLARWPLGNSHGDARQKIVHQWIPVYLHG